ncbi:MAG TPA: class I SAM-dependent methyltransferase [Alphaproteobacteria bacterium]
MSDPVQAQYEAYPYPPRDPRDEAKRLILGSPSHLAELDHYVFGGSLDLTRPFRALVAGGGTGDAAIMLAQQLAWTGAGEAEVVYLDMSRAARAIAEARAARRGLSNIRFVTGSLLELDALDLGTFDYIDCCGVLHHLPDPAAGLAALTRALAPHGGMGLMLYGALGRTGVYHVQAMLNAIAPPTADPAARLQLARRLVAQLPATNWLKRNPFVTDHIVEGDAGLYDLLLHARDRAYTVEEIGALLDGAGLRLESFVPPARYEPASYISDAALLKRIQDLPPLARAAFAERLAGNIKAHVFYAVRAENPVTAPRPDTPDLVPVLFDASPEQLARGLKPGGMLTVSAEGLSLRFPLPRLAPAICGLIDGTRTLDEIRAALATKAGPLDWPAFAAEFASLFAALNGSGKLFLRRRR